MSFRPTRTVAPAADLLDLATVKTHLRVDGTDEDALISALIGAVTAHLDGYAGILGRCLINQTWVMLEDEFEASIDLPFPDVSSVTLQYYDAANTLQTVASGNYQVLERDTGSVIELYSNYTTPAVYAYREDVVKVTLIAGYGTAASDVPASILAAALLLVGHWFENREAVNIGNITSELPLAVRALLAPYSLKTV